MERWYGIHICRCMMIEIAIATLVIEILHLTITLFFKLKS